MTTEVDIQEGVLEEDIAVVSLDHEGIRPAGFGRVKFTEVQMRKIK